MYILRRVQTIRWLVALATFSVATITLLYGPSRLEYPAPFYISHLASVFDTLILAATFYASIGLIVGQKIAWRAAVCILGAAAIWDTLESRELVTSLSLFPLIGLGILVITRHYYRLASGRILPSHAFRRALYFALGSTVSACLAFYLLAAFEHRSFDLARGFIESLDRMYALQNVFMPSHHVGPEHIVGRIILLLLGITNYILVAFALLQPVADHFRLTPALQRDVRDLLDRYATSSEDYFKYFPHDKSYYFGRHVDGFIAYGVYRSTCVALADPIAANPARKEQLLEEFLSFCEAAGWRVAFITVSEASRSLYESTELKTVKIGETAQVAIADYVEGSLDKKARNVVNRFTKLGYVASFERPNPGLLRELRTVSDSWLSHSGRKEYQFAMGYFSDDYLKQCRIFTVRDNAGELVAFVNLQPNYSTMKVASIDMMRSRQTAPPNTMDYVLIELIKALHQEQWQRLDLGLAPLSGLETARSFNERGLHMLYRYANRWYAFHGLRRFKNKFQPTWEASYLAYSGSSAQLASIVQATNELMKFKQ